MQRIGCQPPSACISVKQMWHCPNCGEQIDNVFDACWKCGTAQDGTLAADFQAKPSDSETLDPGAQQDALDETAKDSAAGLKTIRRPLRIVELCSATNLVQAFALRGFLSKPVSGPALWASLLGNAAGWLPFGETVSARGSGCRSRRRTRRRDYRGADRPTSPRNRSRFT